MSELPHWRGIFCNRTLNFRPLKAIGYDMDYTLIHYHVGQWERRAYETVREKLAAKGWPVEGLEFDAESVVRGLIIDKELGNLVKANRFGYVKAAAHGGVPLGFDEWRTAYARTAVDLSEDRWVFLNTLFDISEACMWGQLVARMDSGQEIPGVLTYSELYSQVRGAVDAAHMEGELKAEIMADPDRFVDLDPEVPLTLLDQKRAGKKILLITNSGWVYTKAMMEYAFDPFLPKGMAWQDLFDVKIVSARKPAFFMPRQPLFEIVDEAGSLLPVVGEMQDGKTYL
ncbi:MAG: 5'-nucleotidase, partial [Myxococcota bacterium]